MSILARHYATGRLIEVTANAGRVLSVRETPDAPRLSADWIAPSFFDIQVNGCLGISFNSGRLTADEVWRVAEACRAHGTGGFCPTLITASRDDLTHGFATLARLRESEREMAGRMPGFHLEGPYIAAEDGPRGAHPKAHVRPPDWDEFCRWQDAARGRIRIVTLAPELPRALPFTERLVAAGVIASIGHTAAAPEQIRAAIAAGARLSTHLGNGTHAVLPRHPNYVWEQLAADELWASVIADGHHLPASVLKAILRVKSQMRTVLISDAGSLAGLPPGRYECWGQEFDVHPAGKIVRPGTDFLAGSAVFLDSCVGNVLNCGLADLPAAIEMVASRPRELLGLPVPRIEPGEAADFVLFDWQPGAELKIKTVLTTRG